MTMIPGNLIEEAKNIKHAIENDEPAPAEALGVAAGLIALDQHEDPQLAVEVKEAYRLAHTLDQYDHAAADDLRHGANLLAAGEIEDARDCFDDALARVDRSLNTNRAAIEALANA